MGLNFDVNGESRDIKMNGGLAVNDADAYVMCGVNGAGIIQAPLFMLASHIESGELKEILAPWKVRPMPLSAVYPHNRHLAPKVRVFVEWVAEICEQSPLAFARTRPSIGKTRDDHVIAMQSGRPTDLAYSEETELVAST